MFSRSNRYIYEKKLPAGCAIRPGFLPFFLGLIILLTACSERPASVNLVAPSTPKVIQAADDSVDYSGLQEFVQAINDQYVDEGLSLFNEDAILNEIDQVAFMANLHQNGWNHNYTGDAEVKEWLETEIGSNAQLAPAEYRLYGNYPSMEGALYYDNQAMNIRLIEKSENGKISFLIYNILSTIS